MSYVTIAKIEADRMSPTVATLEKLAAALGISVRALFSEERPGTSKWRRRRP